ncbi:hypothetical protein CXF92_02785 [Pseudomonas sp. Choline-3u-10]|uniref:pilus assembly PilX family protein n=1 Tax=Pseudomonadaceae TaxID=135621 RepID=UPI00061E9B33|nr:MULTISPECIES: PilX N-terminal domain-containing pilus assembly protein [Pseudomonadaceae]MBU0947800.1 hypothetical protein [Gammaproteobacteria bacterium]HBM07097.1 hypothetical protein [Pseudomonas sp.]KJJ61705.1 hypothetical protein RT21_18440 [Pseudomonas sp. 10B238]MBK3796092.1 hypothetical protein [Stutzerimonas stutzeri]MBK3876594.1 hypothetical protein [Stutzerimonas stutzeri]
MRVSKSQRGSALLVSLVFLLLLTMIGISSIQDSILQERMAGNNRDREVAFQAAEAGLRTAERYLQGAVVGPFETNASGLFTAGSVSVPDWAMSGSTNWLALPADTLAGVDSQPQYIIEEVTQTGMFGLGADEPEESISSYRVTSRGYGASPDARVVLQSTYRR